MKTVFDMVVEDLGQRNEIGMETYGKPLYPFDGRDGLWDAYEEALDLAIYLRKLIAERDNTA